MEYLLFVPNRRIFACTFIHQIFSNEKIVAVSQLSKGGFRRIMKGNNFFFKWKHGKNYTLIS